MIMMMHAQQLHYKKLLKSGFLVVSHEWSRHKSVYMCIFVCTTLRLNEHFDLSSISSSYLHFFKEMNIIFLLDFMHDLDLWVMHDGACGELFFTIFELSFIFSL